jgi:hypothetical protein
MKLKKKKQISSPIFAFHPQFLILTFNFSDFTKIQKKWTKFGLGARLRRTLQIFLIVPRTDVQQILLR